ncbi:MAG: CDP-2,3-bis-(O-geranylgeranyl)-sn-glycerol synthase [Thermoprotei archaeon]
MNGLAEAVGETLFYLLPALVANASPVLVGSGHPVDMGRTLGGKRIFGDGKTFEGFLLGFAAGLFVAAFEATFWVPRTLLFVGAELSAGALLGDLAGAFVKRRLQLARGAPAPLLDQLDFLLGAYLLAGAINSLHYGELRVFANALPAQTQFTIVLTSLYLIPLLHLATNAGAFKLRLKPNPW